MTITQILGVLVTLSASPLTLAADPSAPSLLFNWTLRNIDAPLKLETFKVVNPNDPNSPAANNPSYGSTAKVEFIGSAISFNGLSSGWETTGSDGLPKRAGYAYVSGDATWDSKNKEIFKPVSDSVLWDRSTPRFKRYEMSIQAFEGNWTLNNVDVMTGMNSSAASLAEVPTRVEKFITDDNKLNPFYNTTGRWEVEPASDLPVHAKCYDDAILRVGVPLGTAYLIVNGTRSSISSNMYFEVESDNQRDTWTVDSQFPTSTEALLFMTPLNPQVAHTLIVTCVFAANNGENGLTSMTFYEGSVDDDQKSDTSQTGTTQTGTDHTANPTNTGANSDAAATTKPDHNAAVKSGIPTVALIVVVMALSVFY